MRRKVRVTIISLLMPSISQTGMNQRLVKAGFRKKLPTLWLGDVKLRRNFLALLINRLD
ncbi:hypothetical protein LCGC14_0107130 [marine sediment metagenome]|uniref:Uncharacterized protein n=1 Tax=marine sediment metagenome TaxID=412755 RepID=A0A0F9VQW9_9ZZZZ